MLRDLGSRNGTWVNGERATSGAEVELRNGDEVTIGEASIVVILVEQDRSSGRPRKRARQGSSPEPDDEFVMLDPVMLKRMADARRVAATDLHVLVTGETGVGKEMFALAIHRASRRATGRLFRINCASIPEALLESELFGHEKGAFTGATGCKVGLFEAANGGTLFLDEVGELNQAAQAKLLRVLEDGSLMRLGGTREIHVDTRVVAATNRDLEQDVAAGRFRQDLLFRLNGFTIHIPPLRERPSELLSLAELFVGQFAAQIDRKPPRLSPRAQAVLRAHSWPGNVRELRNAMGRCVVLCDEERIGLEDLPEGIVRPPSNAGDRASSAALDSPPVESQPGVKSRVEELERRALVEGLDACGGNRTHTAQRLGISRRSLLYKMKKHGIS